MTKLCIGFIAFILSTTLLPKAAVAAAPLCARVMMPEISAADISATVTSLAEMRLQLDSLQVEGSSKTELRVLKEIYPLKLAELKRALSDRHSEVEIRKMIVAEVSKLQKNASRETRKKIESRASERAAILHFVKKKFIEFSKPVASYFFEYFREQDFVLFLNSEGNALMKKDLTSGAETLLFSDSNQRIIPLLHPDGIHLLVHDLAGNLWKVDVNSGQSTPMSKLDIGQNLRVSPDGSKLFAVDRNHILIYDIASQTQRMIEHNNRTHMPSPLTSNTILNYTGNGVYSISILDSNIHSVIPTNGRYDRMTLISDDATVIGLFNKKQLEIVDINNLSSKRKVIKSPLFAKVKNFIKIPGQDFYIANFIEDKMPTFGLVSLKNPADFTLVFDEYTRVDGPPFLEFRFSKDMKSAAVLVYDSTKAGSIGVDLWENLH